MTILWVNDYYKISETLGTMTILLNLRDTDNDNIIKSPETLGTMTILLNLRDTGYNDNIIKSRDNTMTIL